MNNRDELITLCDKVIAAMAWADDRGLAPPALTMIELREATELATALRTLLTEGGGDEQDKCPDCDGVGEVHQSTSVPDDEGWSTCELCGGSAKIGLDRLRALVNELNESEAAYWGVVGEKNDMEWELKELRALSARDSGSGVDGFISVRASRLLAIRECLQAMDLKGQSPEMEAYHHLYMAIHEVAANIYHPWETLEVACTEKQETGIKNG